MAVDLHLHTHHSDGTWSPADLVERAQHLGLSHIAITDHDTVSGIDAAIAAAKGRLEVIPGIEINTVWQTGGGDEQDIHILGYFIDRENNELRSLIKRQQDARLHLVHDTIDRLTQLGINLTFDEVEALAGDGSIGRPHITRAIVQAGGAADVNEAYEKFMVRTSPYYVRRRSISPLEAISAIRCAGGVASIAHPGGSPLMPNIILELKNSGLQAIEVYHRRHSAALVRRYLRFAKRHMLVATGGSDCHGPFRDAPASIGSIFVPPDVVDRLRQLAGRAC